MADTDNSWIREGGTAALIEVNNQVAFETIDRLTATVIILANGRRFRRTDGRHDELSSDNGHGHKTNRNGKLAAPTDRRAINLYARQQLAALASDLGRITSGGTKTLYTMDAAAVVATLDDLRDQLNAAHKEICRRALAAEAAGDRTGNPTPSLMLVIDEFHPLH